MKKLLLLFSAAALLAGCSDSEIKESVRNAVPGSGTLSLGVAATPDVEILTVSKAGTVPADAASYTVTITNSSLEGFTTISKTFGELGSTLTLKASTDYAIAAESCTEAASLSANSGWGKARYSASRFFGITAGKVTDVELNCTMVNTQVSIGFDASFTDLFSAAAGYSVTASDGAGRSLEFTQEATTDAPIAFFNVPATGKLTLTIAATRISDGQVCTFTQPVNVAAATWQKLTLKASTTNGQTSISITVEQAAETPVDVVIDPYA